MSNKSLVVGNWKMHLTTAEAIKLVTELKSKMKANPQVEVVVAPPFTALNTVEIALQGSSIKIAGQNVHFEDEGAFTGEISVPMLKDVGCHFVLIGHSERRHIFQESNEIINKKLRAAIHGELTPIFCVGETSEQRRSSKAFSTIEEQIKRGLSGLSNDDVARFVIAYEPVWAIGTGETATPQQAQEMHQHIRNFVSKSYDKPAANSIRLLYGGSVNPGNAADLKKQHDVDGLLVGGASLDASKLAEIIVQVGGN